MCIIQGHDISDCLKASFDGLLRNTDIARQIQEVLVSLLFSLSVDAIVFTKVTEGLLAIRCDGYEALKLLLVKVCAETTMDIAAEHREDDLRRFAEHIQEMYRLFASEQKSFTVNDSWRGYRWDNVLEEWIARSPEKVPACNGHYGADQQHGRESDTTAGKRKSFQRDFEIQRDDDFQFKRLRRIPATMALKDSPETVLSSRNLIIDRTKQYLEDGSEDELSLL
jgi:hypothetical protein